MKHGHTSNYTISAEYRAWQHMKERCYNKNNKRYNDYGGRGICVCDRWLDSFENFYSDMGARPSVRHSLDRYPNNDGGYEPSNCRWATTQQQSKGKRNERLIQFEDGFYTMKELAAKLGKSNDFIRGRFIRGYKEKNRKNRLLVLKALSIKPLTVPQLKLETGLDRKGVYNALSPLKELGAVKHIGDKQWAFIKNIYDGI